MKKKISLTLLFIFLCMFSFSNAEKTEEEIIENEIYSAFFEISKLEALLESNEIGYSELVAIDKKLAENISYFASPNEKWYYNHPNKLDAFLYGCIFGPIGVLVVSHQSDKDKKLVKKSVAGCLASSCVVATVNVSIYAAFIFVITSGSTMY